ncbi:MAG: hypothetical protein LBG44_10675 [Gemmatimonadota bacterium]|jgi:type IV pilus assembly protein PilQ|nr:hypothetical protein [Gemmatimonadota bacterium]
MLVPALLLLLEAAVVKPGIAQTPVNEEEPASAGASVLRASEVASDISDIDVSERVTVTFAQAEIQDVLATFAEFSRRSIIPGAAVKGEVTAAIRNQPWDIALGAILRAHGLSMKELPSGILLVDAPERLELLEAAEPLMTRTFRVDYVPVGEAADALEALRSERGRISVNPSANTLVITDAESVVKGMTELLAQLDVRVPRVSIQAEIIFVNRTNVEELGLTYQLEDRGLSPSSGSFSDNTAESASGGSTGNGGTSSLTGYDGGINLGGSLISAIGNAHVRVQQPQLEAVISLIIGSRSLTTFLDALRILELSDVQASPTITTLDNQQAEIWVGERTPLRVVDVGSTGNASGSGEITQPRATAQLVETGIRLRVTPTVTADRRILMQLHAERSSAQLAATDIGVVFQQQQGTTRLLVRNGETAVIGGLTVTERSTTRAGIPLLMDLPLIGTLFRTTREREQKRDLVILVTPRILEDQS